MFKISKSFKKAATAFSLVFMFSQCGGSAGTTTTTSSTSDLSTTAVSANPVDFAIASPTATTSSNASLNEFLIDSETYYSTITAGSGYTDKSSIFRTILAAATDSVCQVTLPTLSFTRSDPTCYGPALDYQNHPDGAGGSGQLPTGDLGIWTSTATGSQACSAAKINSDLQRIGDQADYTMLLSASMTCLMVRAGTAMPASDGDVVTMTSDLNTAIQVNNSSVTITNATATNLTDVTVDGVTISPIQFDFTLTDTRGSSSITITSGMRHLLVSSSSSQFKGRIWTEISGAGAPGDKTAVSIKYERVSSNSLKYSLHSADYQAATSSTVIFDSTKNLDVTGGWTGNMALGIFSINPSTGLGDFSYAWQAGNGDDKARIFNGFNNANDGCSFFGYGDRFNTSTGAKTDSVIDGFICNWAGPGNDHTMSTTSGIAQKQCMTVNTTSGVFEVDTTKNFITYAPTVSCNSAGTLGIKLTSETSFDTSSITNNLRTLSTDSDFLLYTAPSEPVLPSGI